MTTKTTNSNREETSALYREYQEIIAKLPNDPITPEIEQRIVESIRRGRAEDKAKAKERN